MKRHRRVIIESPYAGDIERNIAYAHRCVMDSIRRGESPIAFHLLFPPVLDDHDIIERDVGLKLSQSWYSAADVCAVYTDLGVSQGMRIGIIAARRLGLAISWRKLRP